MIWRKWENKWRSNNSNSNSNSMVMKAKWNINIVMKKKVMRKWLVIVMKIMA